MNSRIIDSTSFTIIIIVPFTAAADFSPLSSELTIRTDSPPCRVIQVLPDQVVENTESFQVLVSSDDESVNIVSGVATIDITDTTSECIFISLNACFPGEKY